MAEAILNNKGGAQFTAYSAGSHPYGEVHPLALKELERARISTEGLRSKSWDEFEKPGAPKMDFLLTLCDDAARETCPVWPGHPMTAHWGMPDPGNAGDEPGVLERAFREAFMILDHRIRLFLCLPLSSLDKLAIKEQIERIGHE